nr:hypothetical protein [Calothrix sp. MO_167.B42]
LGIRFVVGNHELEIYRPDGRQFLSSVELEQRAQQERQRAEQAEQQLQDMQALLQQYRDRFGELDS